MFSKSNRNAVNIIARIAVAAVVVGSMSLFVVLSGFSGLKDFALQFTNVFDSDLRVTPSQGKTWILSEQELEKLQSIEGVHAVSRIVEERIFLQYKGRNHIANIKGVDQSYRDVVAVDSLLFLGDWMERNQAEVVVGFGITNKLSLPVRDYGNFLQIYVPKPGTGQINELDPSSAFTRLNVIASGVYEINDDLNSKYVFSELETAQALLGIDPLAISALEFRLAANSDLGAVKSQIVDILGRTVEVKDRVQQNDALYKMLNSENLFTYLFVSLIAAIAIFNIAGTIIMIILEKRHNIKTLYSLGLSLKEIRKVFYYNGLLMVLLGLVIGLVLGSIAVGLQLQFGFVPITPSLPYPVKFNLLNVLLVFATISLLGALASRVASLKVSSKLLD